MKRILLLLAFVSLTCNGQEVVLPGDPSIDAGRIAPGHSSMSYLVSVDGKWMEIGTFDTDLAFSGSELRASTSMNFNGTSKRLNGSQVMDAGTLRPISSSSEQERGRLSVSFSDAVSGEFVVKETGERIPVHRAFSSPYFDSQTYAYVLRALPLRSGYRAILPVYAYEAKDVSRPSNIIIREVTSGSYVSRLTGEHPVWRVDVREDHSGNRFEYIIDQKSHRLRQVEIAAYNERSGTTFFRLVDREVDFQPYQSVFDKEAARAMIHDGTSTIRGRASAQLMLSINGRRNAQRGTRVLLIPDTPFYREWVALNERRTTRDKLDALPLPEEVAAAIKVAEISDDRGSFEFTNLQPGDYILTTRIQYQYGYSQTVETGRAAVYYKNAYQGDSVQYGTVRRAATGEASPEAKVTIRREGETVDINLTDRKWLW